MNENELFEAIGNTDDELIEKSEEKPIKNRSWIKWTGLSAACICALVIGYAAIHKIHLDNYVADVPPETTTTTQHVVIPPSSPLQLLAAPVYPEMSPWPNEEDFFNPDYTFNDKEYSIMDDNHWNDVKRQVLDNKGYSKGFADFCGKTMPTFLKAENGENIIYSPINLYMALGMLSEITDGNSRQQILDVLSVEDTPSLQKKIKSMWNANYCDDGFYTSLLANSLWLRNDTAYEEETMKNLADNYYASSYSGTMGSDEMNKAIQKWLNDNTGGFLSEEAGDITLSEDNMVTLASTVYFNAQWTNNSKFFEEKTEPRTFTTLNGEEITCDFMYQNDYRYLIDGEKYTAIYLNFDSIPYNAGMWFILPDEGVSTDEVISSEDMLYMINNDYNDIVSVEYTAAIINDEIVEYQIPYDIKALEKDLYMYVPKFDISYNSEFTDKLSELGITDVLDFGTSDYSPLTVDDNVDVMLSEAKQAVRVMIDEEGCTAASFVVMPNPGAGGMIEEPEPYDFILDRPFIFCITGSENTPLFIGVVNNPNS